MAKLIYSAISSLDGYIEDAEGRFDWAEPDDEVLAFVNDLERPIGTYLLGRRMYETMVFWESPPDLPKQPRVVQDFAEIWQKAEKIVYSRTLQSASSAKTRIEREFDQAAVRRLKATAAADITVGGAELAAQAIEAALIDEYHLFLVPFVVGGGKRSLPDRNVRVNPTLPARARSAERFCVSRRALPACAHASASTEVAWALRSALAVLARSTRGSASQAIAPIDSRHGRSRLHRRGRCDRRRRHRRGWRTHLRRAQRWTWPQGSARPTRAACSLDRSFDSEGSFRRRLSFPPNASLVRRRSAGGPEAPKGVHTSRTLEKVQ